MRKIGYDIIAKNANSKSADFDKLVTEAEYKWYIKDTPFARKSNLYCVMNYRFKFNAIGLDYVRAEEAGISKPLSKEEYMSIYCGENRRNLMIMEHYRWCAFHICHGFIPATIAEILYDRDADGRYTNGKDFMRCTHGNITTMAGLNAFAEIISKRDNISLEEADVIKYDYQTMDQAYEYLQKSGYVIVRRQ